jgi:alpha-ketoglutarate-dependent taurine dioxygenase
MIINNIYSNWATQCVVNYHELLEIPNDTWKNLLVTRGLLYIKGIPNTLTDSEFYEIGKKFGTLWSVEDHSSGVNGWDATLNKNTLNTPTSYFKTTNNNWTSRNMDYHADMAHIGEKSFPGRVLYMIRTAKNNSGVTDWLNLEIAYDQFTDEEKLYYSDVKIYQHFMYDPGTNITEYPFLKTNPFSGKISPRLNCYDPRGKTWIHHISKNEKKIEDIDELVTFMNTLYRLCESKKDALYSHTWTNGDIIVYDNWNSVHRRSAITFGEGESDRLLKRLTFNI